MCNTKMNRTFVFVCMCFVLLTIAQNVNSKKNSLQPSKLSNENPSRDFQISYNKMAENVFANVKSRVKRQINNNRDRNYPYPVLIPVLGIGGFGGGGFGQRGFGARGFGPRGFGGRGFSGRGFGGRGVGGLGRGGFGGFGGGRGRG